MSKTFKTSSGCFYVKLLYMVMHSTALFQLYWAKENECIILHDPYTMGLQLTILGANSQIFLFFCGLILKGIETYSSFLLFLL